MCRLLLAHGAKAGVLDAKGHSPLHYAAQNGFPVICQILAAKMDKMEGGENVPEAELLVDRSPFARHAFLAGLGTACRWVWESMRRCRRKEAGNTKLTTKKSKAVPSPLAFSVLQCHTKCVEVLLQSGYNAVARVQVGDELMPSPYDSALLAFRDIQLDAEEERESDPSGGDANGARPKSHRQSLSSSVFMPSTFDNIMPGQARLQRLFTRSRSFGSIALRKGSAKHDSISMHDSPLKSSESAKGASSSEHRHVHSVREKRRRSTSAIVNQLNKQMSVRHLRRTFAFAHYLVHEIPHLLLFVALLVVGPNGDEIQNAAGAFVLNNVQAKEQV